MLHHSLVSSDTSLPTSIAPSKAAQNQYWSRGHGGGGVRWGRAILRRRTFQSCVAYVAPLLFDMGLSHKLASYSVSGMKPSVVRRNSGCYTACVVLHFISLYFYLHVDLTTLKLKGLLHCVRPATEFPTRFEMSTTTCSQVACMTLLLPKCYLTF